VDSINTVVLIVNPVNNKTVSRQLLRHDDLIDIKTFRLIFKLEEKDQCPEEQLVRDEGGIPSRRLPLI